MKKFLFKGITVLAISFFVLSGSAGAAHAASGSSDVSQVRMEQLLKIIEQLTAILKELQSRAGVPSSQGSGHSFDSSDDAELEIEIEVRTSTAKVKVKQDHDVDRFVIDTTDHDEIITEIANRTGLSETEVRANASFEDDSTDDHGSDDDDDDDDDDDHGGNSGHGGGSDD